MRKAYSVRFLLAMLEVASIAVATNSYMCDNEAHDDSCSQLAHSTTGATLNELDSNVSYGAK